MPLKARLAGPLLPAVHTEEHHQTSLSQLQFSHQKSGFGNKIVISVLTFTILHAENAF